MIYTGIGSRETPYSILTSFFQIGWYMGAKEHCLRSGGANGADLYFEKGCNIVQGKKEIYLPWKNFNNNSSSLYIYNEEVLKLAEYYHPYWKNLSEVSKKFHIRNVCQVLGENLDQPSDVLICYTKEGREIGGTSQAIRIAKDYHIPIFNAGSYSNSEDFMQHLWKFVQKKQGEYNV